MSIDEQIKTMPTLAPEALDDFQIVRHFCDRPIFIRSFYGPIKLKSFRRDSDYEILFAKDIPSGMSKNLITFVTCQTVL